MVSSIHLSGRMAYSILGKFKIYADEKQFFEYKK